MAQSQAEVPLGKRQKSDVTELSESLLCAWVLYEAIEEREKLEVRRGIKVDPVWNLSALDFESHWLGLSSCLANVNNFFFDKMEAMECKDLRSHLNSVLGQNSNLKSTQYPQHLKF